MNNNILFIKDLLWFFVFWGLIAGIFRMWFGLGATTNLTDEVPWGLWKILNMIAGVALSTCGFTLGFLVYVLKIEKFKHLIKPAILIAFLGYGSSCLALLFDIGLPQRFWHPFIWWNEHSFLFEVFWCVILYFTVTFIELTPNLLERFRAKKIVHFLHKIAPGVVIVGISLSSLHHSSLGSLFLTTPTRLHELWYSPMIPWMFIVSAMGCGIFFLVFVKIAYSRLYNPESVFGQEYLIKSSSVCLLNDSSFKKAKKVYGKDMPMLSRLSIISASILGFYLILKIYDLIASGSYHVLFAGTWESYLFSFELLITAVLPIVLVSIKRTRNSPYGIGTAAISASVGLALNRIDVGIFGYFSSSGTVYFPSLAEWSLSIGVVAAAALAFIYISENFSIFDNKWQQQKVEKGAFHAAFDSFSRVWTTTLQEGFYRISLIAVFILPLAFVLMYPYYSGKESNDVLPAKGLDTKRAVLLIDGNAGNVSTKFPHEDHQRRLGDGQSCIKCHHLSMPKDHSTPCARCHRSMLNETKIFDHSYHTFKVAANRHIGGLHPENYTCTICHGTNKSKTIINAKACIDCHIEDMKMQANIPKTLSFKFAISYMNAMHKNCIPCHEEQSDIVKKNLYQCSTCHKNMKNQ